MDIVIFKRSHAAVKHLTRFAAAAGADRQMVDFSVAQAYSFSGE